MKRASTPTSSWGRRRGRAAMWLMPEERSWAKATQSAAFAWEATQDWSARRTSETLAATRHGRHHAPIRVNASWSGTSAYRPLSSACFGVRGSPWSEAPTRTRGGDLYGDVIQGERSARAARNDALNSFHLASASQDEDQDSLDRSGGSRRGQQRILRRMRQLLSWAFARSPGPR